ncbi:MAG: neutral zinc metallopeptidase [Patescibacteria group bacterium]
MANWGKLSSRGNVQDRRGAGAAIGGGIGAVVVIAGIIFSLLSGGEVNINDLLSLVPDESQTSLTSSDFEGADQYEVFASTVLGSTNDYWHTQFSESGQQYTEPSLVLFRSATQSACGIATSDVGPHYCPLDQTIYIDETFFIELQQRFKAKGGDVAEAYVIAHEVGHHVQNQLGNLEKAQQNGTQAAAISIELQADCYAGSWANSLSDLGVFEPNEISEAIDAAAAVGDDRIQQSVNGQVSPETWTHGSSADRVKWFTTGFNSGNPEVCNDAA